MRGRDVRAISFCVATTVVLAGIVYVLSRSVIITAALVGAWLAFVLTRPRMQRVIRRARGDVDWSGYYRDE